MKKLIKLAAVAMTLLMACAPSYGIETADGTVTLLAAPTKKPISMLGVKDAFWSYGYMKDGKLVKQAENTVEFYAKCHEGMKPMQYKNPKDYERKAKRAQHRVHKAKIKFLPVIVYKKEDSKTWMVAVAGYNPYNGETLTVSEVKAAVSEGMKKDFKREFIKKRSGSSNVIDDFVKLGFGMKLSSM